MNWKPIKDFEGLYCVSDCGSVKSLGNGQSTNTSTKAERIISHTISSNGYTKIKLSKGGKKYWFSVHRLVASAFISNEDNKPQVNHRDGDKLNNHVSNLEWCTAKENIRHSVDTGLQVATKGADSPCSKQINQLTLDGKLVKTWGSIKEACRELGVNSFGIIKCCKKEKKYNTAYKFRWEYV